MRCAGVLSAVFPLVAAVLAGCPTLPEPVPCGQIPSGGCPIARGGTCDDLACTALFACVDGTWISTQRCSREDAGLTASDGGGGGGPSSDGGPCTPPSIDNQGQGTGCTPDLLLPDCPIEVALPCAESACISGCLDFFICGANHDWTYVAYCDDDGSFIVTR